MKKVSIYVFAAIFALSATAASTQEVPFQTGIILDIYGPNVEICTPGASCISALTGMRLYRDQTLVSGFDSRVVVELTRRDGSIIYGEQLYLAANSFVEMKPRLPVQKDPNSYAVQFDGLIRYLFQGEQPSSENMPPRRVFGPRGGFLGDGGLVSMCGSRMTHFYMQTLPDDGIDIGLFEGAITCECTDCPDRSTIDMTGGQRVFLSPRGFSDPAPITIELFDTVVAATSPTTTSPQARFPRPDLGRVFTSIPSRYGDIHFNAGWYGNQTKTIKVTSTTWDAAKGQWVVVGTWGHNNSNDGGFEFNFNTPCSFSGSWGSGTSRTGTTWSGNCKN